MTKARYFIPAKIQQVNVALIQTESYTFQQEKTA
jgi:hypothetical protein